MHKPNQIVILKDGTLLVVEPLATGLSCNRVCYFRESYKKDEEYYHRCNQELVREQLSNCKVPEGYCYHSIKTEEGGM